MKYCTLCLNPYYNGRYSWSPQAAVEEALYKIVLILIIMEDTHGVCDQSILNLIIRFVLILIIMEDTHGDEQTRRIKSQIQNVLILIIMEDTHGESNLVKLLTT